MARYWPPIAPIPFDPNGVGPEYEGAPVSGYRLTAHARVGPGGQSALALGQSLANGQRSLAVSGEAHGYGATAVGDYALAAGERSVGVGQDARVTSHDATGVGADAEALGVQSVALGSAARAKAPRSTAIGGLTVIRREQAAIEAVDLMIKRSPSGPYEDTMVAGGAVYNGTAETGLILTDVAGGQWRITMSAAGEIEIATHTAASFQWALLSGAGSAAWSGIACSYDSMVLIACPYGGYLKTSVNAGSSWTTRTAAGNRTWQDVCIANDGVKMIASYGAGTYRSANGGSTWSAATFPGGGYASTLAASSDLVTVYGQSNQYFYKSTDSGATWSTLVVPDMPYGGVWLNVACSADGLVVYISGSVANGYNTSFIYRSDDGGGTWESIWDEPYRSMGPLECNADGTHVITSETYGHLWTSTSSGASWSEHTESGDRWWYGYGFSADGDRGLAAVNEGGGLYTSDSSGAWAYVDGSAQDEYGFNRAIVSGDGTTLYAAGQYIYRD